MSFGALIFPPVPELLFHYTDQAGLFGILKSGELWASRIHCLNDHQEFQHGLHALRSAIIADPKFPSSLLAQEQIAEAFERVEKVNVCVSSWSEHRDQLSQWRAYGKSRQGYGLGILGNDLTERARQLGWKLGRCVYKNADKEILSKILADLFWQRFFEHHVKNPLAKSEDRLAPMIDLVVLPFAAFFKHDGFAEEAEWRLVSPLLPHIHERFVVRPGPVFPITFYRFPLVENSSDKLNAEIMVGPGPSQELAEDGALVAGWKSRFDVTSCRRSRTPWRTDS